MSWSDSCRKEEKEDARTPRSEYQLGPEEKPWTGLALWACRCHSWKGREVDTHYSCLTGPLALLQPEGHGVKVSLHRVVFVIITRTSEEGGLGVEQSLQGDLLALFVPEMPCGPRTAARRGNWGDRGSFKALSIFTGSH